MAKMIKKYFSTKLPHWGAPQLYTSDDIDRFETIDFHPVYVIPEEEYEEMRAVLGGCLGSDIDESLTRRIAALLDGWEREAATERRKE